MKFAQLQRVAVGVVIYDKGGCQLISAPSIVVHKYPIVSALASSMPLAWERGGLKNGEHRGNTVTVNVGVPTSHPTLYVSVLVNIGVSTPQCRIRRYVAQGWGLCLQSPGLHYAVRFYFSPITDPRTRIAHANNAT